MGCLSRQRGQELLASPLMCDTGTGEREGHVCLCQSRSADPPAQPEVIPAARRVPRVPDLAGMDSPCRMAESESPRCHPECHTQASPGHLQGWGLQSSLGSPNPAFPMEKFLLVTNVTPPCVWGQMSLSPSQARQRDLLFQAWHSWVPEALSPQGCRENPARKILQGESYREIPAGKILSSARWWGDSGCVPNLQVSRAVVASH